MTNEGVPQDVVFRLLSHVYRRALLECLDHHDGPVSVADAARDVARECKERPLSEISAKELTDIHLSLRHSHVPQLADEGTVSYDRNRNRLALTERGERVVAVHDRLTTAGPVEVVDSGD